jgi:spore germination cell wall hydrolase CwlJ-like protein
MELTAYVNGDVMTLTQILSQISMALGGGTFQVAAKSAALIGIIVAIFSGLLKGGQLNPGTFLWPLIISVMLLTPRIDLVIEDTRGGISRVDDLPIGFAAPVSIITHMGMGVSRLMTEYLGLDDNAITMENGHLVSLRAPIVYSQVITQEEFQGPAATFSNGLSPTKDASAYIQVCLQWKAKVAGSDVRLPVLRSRTVDELRVEEAPRTVGASDGKAYECGVLFDRLMAGFDSNDFQERLNDAVSQAFGKYSGDTTTGTRYQNALENVIDDLPEFYKAAAFSHALQMVSGDITQAAGGGSQQAALNDALAQKREKNFGAAAMIFETIGHTIEFIEVWSFSIFPLALLMLMVGAVGAKFAFKYMWMLVWVQLWYPTLLIVMDYLDAKLQMVAISSTATIANYSNFMLEVLRLQDVGYVHLSMATALSMGLVFGSSAILASGIQKDLTGDQHYDPKKNSPDTLSRNAQTAFHSPFSYSPNQGYIGHSAKESFAGAQFAFDSKLSEGANWAETAQFARTGQRATTATASTAEAVTTGASVTSTHAATTDWSAGANTGTSLEAGHSGVVDSKIGDLSQRSETDQQRRSITTSVGANASAGIGAKVAGSGAQAGVSMGVGAAREGSNINLETNSQTAGTGYTLGDRVTTAETAGSRLSYGKGEQQSDSQSERSDRTETAQRGESVSEGASTSRSDSQSKGNSGSEMVSKQASQSYDGLLAANRIAQDSNLMDNLTRTVIDSGISHQVDNFMESNRDKLDNTFAGPHGEDAKYALSAMYVMQGLTGNVYAGQENSQERMNVLNALGDEILWQSGFSSTHSQNGAPSMDELRNSNPVDPSQIDNAYSRVNSGFDLSEDLVDSALDRMPTHGDPKSAMDSLFSTIGGQVEDITEGQGNGILSQARERIDRDFGPISEDAASFMSTRRELGVRAAVQDLYRDNQDIRDSDVYKNYRSTKDEGWFSDGKGASEMLDDRMQQLNASGIAAPDNDLARFMVASQLYAGAINAGDEDMAQEFQNERERLIEDNPGFGAGDTEERLTGIAMMGTNDSTMRDSIIRGQQEAQIGGLQHEMEAISGHSLNAAGENVSWEGSSDRSGAPIRYEGDGEFGPAIQLSSRDRDIAIRTVIGEAASESDQGQAAVAHVLRNRLEAGGYGGSSVSEVALAPKQFSAWNSGAGGNHLVQKYDPGDEAYERAGQLVDGVFSGQLDDPTNGATHYYSPAGMKKLVSDGDQTNVLPRWLEEKRQESGGETTIGGHIFVGRA